MSWPIVWLPMSNLVHAIDSNSAAATFRSSQHSYCTNYYFIVVPYRYTVMLVMVLFPFLFFSVQIFHISISFQFFFLFQKSELQLNSIQNASISWCAFIFIVSVRCEYCVCMHMHVVYSCHSIRFVGMDCFVVIFWEKLHPHAFFLFVRRCTKLAAKAFM